MSEIFVLVADAHLTFNKNILPFCLILVVANMALGGNWQTRQDCEIRCVLKEFDIEDIHSTDDMMDIIWPD